MKSSLLAAATAALALYISAPASAQQSADPAQLDIGNVKLGMDADQAMAALRQAYGRTIMDLRIYDQSVLDVMKINRDMNYPTHKILYSTHRPAVQERDQDYYVNHIVYNLEDPHVHQISVIVDLAKSPDDPRGPARVYQVLQVTRGGFQEAVFQEISEGVADKYGAPTRGNQWCAQVTDGKCAGDKPYLAFYLLKEPVQPIKSVLQLYDPAYGLIGPEGIGSQDAGTLSFGLHT